MTEPKRIAPPPFPGPRPSAAAAKAPMPVRKAVILAAVLGPAGLAFTSGWAGLFTGFLAIVVGVSTVGAGLIFVWLFCAILAFVMAPRPKDTPDSAP